MNSIMGARLSAGHPLATVAVEGVIEEQGLDTQLLVWELAENVLCVIRSVVAAHPCVIATDLSVP